ncbi:hypothetical protein B0H13DRAFT_2667575 [Mycena leptocephala]|nr:hypothetical protein B0H13DRAFT_2667575 [Mycena leptocephala]
MHGILSAQIPASIDTSPSFVPVRKRRLLLDCSVVSTLTVSAPVGRRSPPPPMTRARHSRGYQNAACTRRPQPPSTSRPGAHDDRAAYPYDRRWYVPYPLTQRADGPPHGSARLCNNYGLFDRTHSRHAGAISPRSTSHAERFRAPHGSTLWRLRIAAMTLPFPLMSFVIIPPSLLFIAIRPTPDTHASCSGVWRASTPARTAAACSPAAAAVSAPSSFPCAARPDSVVSPLPPTAPRRAHQSHLPYPQHAQPFPIAYSRVPSRTPPPVFPLATRSFPIAGVALVASSCAPSDRAHRSSSLTNRRPPLKPHPRHPPFPPRRLFLHRPLCSTLVPIYLPRPMHAQCHWTALTQYEYDARCASRFKIHVMGPAHSNNTPPRFETRSCGARCYIRPAHRPRERAPAPGSAARRCDSDTTDPLGQLTYILSYLVLYGTLV